MTQSLSKSSAIIFCTEKCQNRVELIKTKTKNSWTDRDNNVDDESWTYCFWCGWTLQDGQSNSIQGGENEVNQTT